MNLSDNRKRLLVDRDRLMNAKRGDVANGCVNIFDKVQRFPKAIQLLSLACSFILLCDASGVPAQDVFTAGKNLMADPLTQTGLGLQFQAMRYHLNTEVLPGKDPVARSAVLGQGVGE